MPLDAPMPVQELREGRVGDGPELAVADRPDSCGAGLAGDHPKFTDPFPGPDVAQDGIVPLVHGLQPTRHHDEERSGLVAGVEEPVAGRHTMVGHQPRQLLQLRRVETGKQRRVAEGRELALVRHRPAPLQTAEQ